MAECARCGEDLPDDSAANGPIYCDLSCREKAERSAEKVLCPYCVQWRCAECRATDFCDHEFEDGYKIEPYWPDGSVATLTQQETCPRCKQTLADYYADHAEGEPNGRDAEVRHG